MHYFLTGRRKGFQSNATRTFLFAMLLNFFGSLQAIAAKPVMNQPLAPLTIEDKGELLLEGDEVSYAPWRSNGHTGTVHVIQYLAATMSASEIYKPFTDRLESDVEPESLQVTSVINLKAALWGTSGLVMSEVTKHKRKYPDSTMVMDKNGAGTKAWELGKKGSALIILDTQGTVRFLATQALTETQVEEAITLVQQLGSKAEP